MNGQNVFHAFDFENQPIFDHKIEPVATVEFDAFILDRQGHLPLERDSSEMEFVAQTLLVCGFQKSRPQRSMHLDCRSNYALSEFLMQKSSPCRSLP